MVPQSTLNCSLEITITTTSANCNRLHYFNAWNIHKFAYRNDKTIFQLILRKWEFLTTNLLTIDLTTDLFLVFLVLLMFLVFLVLLVLLVFLVLMLYLFFGS